MATAKTVSFVNLSEVYLHLGFTEVEQEVIADFGFSNVSFGDAGFTLIGNHYALECITDGYGTYRDEMSYDEGEPSRNIPEEVLTNAQIAQRFWEIVGPEDYVNLEG